MTVVLRSCAHCGGHWSGYASLNSGDPWFCPKHRHLEVQPFAVGDHIRWIDGPSDAYVAVAIDANRLTYRRVGGDVEWTASVHNFRKIHGM